MRFRVRRVFLVGHIPRNLLKNMAGSTGLEPAASAVTGQRSNQLNYDPTLKIQEMAETRANCGFRTFRIQRTLCTDWRPTQPFLA